MATVINNNCKIIEPAKGSNPRSLYDHQKEAIAKLTAMNKKGPFKSLVVLPTGGGKTMTAVGFLLKNFVEKEIKILWIAHRHMLLEQAAQTFEANAYADEMPQTTEFSYRIISGQNDKPCHIKKDDNIIIAMVDSLESKEAKEYLKEWIGGEEICFVIDEAHHSVAKTYRHLINFIEENCKSLKLLGLTATPYRTHPNEKGALKAIFTDGTCYSISLNDLITKSLLARPFCETRDTNIEVGENLGARDLTNIRNLDRLPQKTQDCLSENKKRNRLIVEEYTKNRKKYGQTIVFAINVDNAIALNKLFKDAGVKSDYIVSNIRDLITHVSVSGSENKKKIEAYKNGALDVLINVNILTEGTDLPKTQSVFLTRPTTSKTLMTQMVGRGLRGERAGGTKTAFIVSFMDDWDSRIDWQTAEDLFEDEDYKPNDKDTKYIRSPWRLVPIALIEMFTRMMDDTIDTSMIDNLPGISRVPVGWYFFTLTHKNEDVESGDNIDYQVKIMVFDFTKQIFENFINDLPNIFESYSIEDDEKEISAEKMRDMIAFAKEEYFAEVMDNVVSEKNIEDLITYHLQREKNDKPEYLSFDVAERKSLDVSTIAKKIIDEDMRQSEEDDYLDKLWNDDSSLFSTFFGRPRPFKQMLDLEKQKLRHPEDFSGTATIKGEIRDEELLPLFELSKVNPLKARKLKELTFKAAKNGDFYECACCHKQFLDRRFLQVDHIIPMAKGGKTKKGNLQILCAKCNGEKGVN